MKSEGLSVIVGVIGASALAFLASQIFLGRTEVLEPQWATVTGTGAEFRKSWSDSWSVLRLEDGREGRLSGYAPIPIGAVVCVQGAKGGSAYFVLRRLPDRDCSTQDDIRP
jgi:hypothetical protein